LRIYLDASVLMAVLAEEPASAAVRRFLRSHREDRLISDFAAAEVASAIARLLRMRLQTVEEGSVRLADFDAWRAAASSAADMHAADARLAYAYVRRFDLALQPWSRSISAWRPPPENWASLSRYRKQVEARILG